MNITMLILEVSGRPMPWKAPYVTKKGAFSSHTNRKHEIQWQLKSQFNQEPWEGAISLKLSFFFAPPKNTSFVKKRQMLSNVIHFTKRPDASNLEKLLCDCGNGILWNDDSQIINLEVSKLYGTKEKTLIMMSRESLWDDQ